MKYFPLIAAVLLLFCTVVQPVYAVELQIPAVNGAQGEMVTLQVSIDKAEKLAGIKLVMTYDQNVLKFVKAEKTKFTANMLHVVNDKVPGKLIVVMASAKGFTAENAPLVKMTFELLKEVKKEESVTLQVSEAELMDDELKRIEIKSR